MLIPHELPPPASIASRDAVAGRGAGWVVLQDPKPEALRPSSPGKCKGSDTASAVQIKATTSKETTAEDKGAFKGSWARGQREFIFYRFILKGRIFLAISLGSPCLRHEASQGSFCRGQSERIRRARDVSQGQENVRRSSNP